MICCMSLEEQVDKDFSLARRKSLASGGEGAPYRGHVGPLHLPF